MRALCGRIISIDMERARMCYEDRLSVAMAGNDKVTTGAAYSAASDR